MTMPVQYTEELTAKPLTQEELDAMAGKKYTGVSNRAPDLRYQADGTFIQETDPEGYEYDVMLEIADILAAAWENGEPDQETKEALIVELTEKYPKSADMIRQMVESFH